MPLHMTARYQIKPASRTKCEQAVKEFVAYIKDNEPRTQLYVSLQETDDHASFLHYFIFEDESAQQMHSNSKALKRFTAVLYPETLAPVEFKRYRVVASTQ